MKTSITTPPSCAAVSLTVVSSIDEVFTSPEARQSAGWLAARNVPLVLVTDREADEVLALQTELGICQPFICRGGAELHLPVGYFREVIRIGVTRNGWNVVEFKAPHDTAHATRFLISLFHLCSDRALVVGLGGAARDRVMLGEVDVPVVVRSGTTDEALLQQAVPAAYLTNARGAAGWSEAVLGSLA